MSLASEYLSSSVKRLKYYKMLGEKTFAQLQETDFHFRPNLASNSIAQIIQHMHGNMISRWTNFLTEDGEKDWRNRDVEFEVRPLNSTELNGLWQQGWECCLRTLESLSEQDLLKTVQIRKESLTVVDAINRQLAHYPYHVGQILYIGKTIRDSGWVNLSVPKGKSAEYNLSEGPKDPANLKT